MNAKMDRDSRWHKTRPAKRVGSTNSARLRDLADLQRDRICAPHTLARLDAGSMPWRWRMFQTLLADSGIPTPISSPWMRLYPQLGFSAARAQD
jgi:hypothetical protein